LRSISVGAQPLHVRINEGEVHRAAEAVLVEIEHRRRAEARPDLDHAPRARLAQHRVQHQGVEVAIRGIVQVEAPARRGPLRKRLLRVPAGKPLEARHLPGLVEIDAWKRRTEAPAGEGLRDFLPRRQRGVEVTRREKPRPVGLRRPQLPEFPAQAVVFLHHPPMGGQQAQQGSKEGTHGR
jgi:hypothetical protein